MDRAPEDLFAQFARTGDPRPLGEVFDRVAPALLRAALHLTPDPATAEDAVQATFLTALSKRGTYQPNRALLPWLMGILERCCARARKQGKRRPDPARLQLPPDTDPTKESEARELRQTLHQHLDALPAASRTVVTLRLLHGLTSAEIAAALDLPPATVRVRLHRGLERLREKLPRSMLLAFCGVSLAEHAPRGLAALRAEVLAGGAAMGPLLVLGGVLVTKKLTTTAVSLLFLGLLAALWSVGVPGLGETVPENDRGLPAAEQARLHPKAAPSGASEATAAARAEVAPDPNPDRHGTLMVRVVHPGSDHPMAAVGISVTAMDGGDIRFGNQRAATGMDGTVRFTLTAGPVHVRSDRAGEQQALVHPGAETVVDLVGQGSMTVIGTVVDTLDQPVPYASIWAQPSSGPHWFVQLTATDAYGAFHLAGMLPQQAIGARAPSHAPSLMHRLWPGRGKEAHEVRLVLRGPGASLEGEVRSEDGTPIADAVVHVLRDPRSFTLADGTHRDGAPDSTTRTDPHGRFAFEGLRSGWVPLEVHAPGFAPASRHAALRLGQVTTLEVLLAPGARILGRVVDPKGEGIVAARISLRGLGPYERADADSDGAGRFQLACVPTGSRTLWATAKGFQSRTILLELEPGPRELDDLVLHPAARVEGRLVDGTGEGLVGYSLRGSGGYTVTTAEGEFSLPIKGADSGTLAIFPPRPRVPLPLTFGPLAPGQDHLLEVPEAALPRSRLEGRLLHADGTPCAGRSIEIGAGDRWSSLTYMTTDSEGRFIIEPLVAGSYSLLTAHWGVPDAPAHFGPFAVGAIGTFHTGDLRLPTPGTVEITFEALDGGGIDAPYLFLHGHGYGETSVPVVTGTQRASRALPPGEHVLSFHAGDAEWVRQPFTIRPGETTEVTLHLRRAVRRYLCFPVPTPGWGAPRTVHYVVLHEDGTVIDEDTFDDEEELPFRYMPGLRTGRYTLELTTDNGQRFAGTFAVPDLTPSHEPILVPVRRL